MQLNLLTLNSGQQTAAVNLIQPWLSALRNPLPALTVAYGLPVWIQTITINNSTDYLLKTTLTNPYSMYLVNSNGAPACTYQAGLDGVTPVNIQVNPPLPSSLNTGINYAKTLPFNAAVVNPRLLIYLGQFKFIWLPESGQVICIEKDLKHVGSFLTLNTVYNYNDVLSTIESDLLSINS